MVPEVQKFKNALAVKVDVGGMTRGGVKNLPFVPELERRKITAVCCFDSDTVSFTADGQGIVSPANAGDLYLTLRTNDNFAVVDEIPYNLYNAVGKSQTIREFDRPVELNIQSGYITASSSISPNVWALFVFFYL